MTGRYLGFDFGTQRIGIASGLPLTGAARPVTTLQARAGVPDWETLDALVAQSAPVGLVVGLPLNLDDTDHEVTRAARQFARRLESRYRLPTHLIDERLSSHAARERLACEPGGDLDSVAACVILETWLACQG